MEVFAIAKNVPMSPQKMREVVRQIQGLPALQAQAVLAVVPRKAARFVAKTLKSAIANAENNKKPQAGIIAREGSRGRLGDDHQTVYAQGARLRRADSQAPLPHQNHLVGRISMGQKTNPIGLRVAVNKDWRSKWYADKKEFGKLLSEDREIRKLLKKKLESASVPRILIERAANRCRITILTARPGVVIGRKGAEIDKLKEEMSKMTGKEVYVDIVEVKTPEIDAQLVAENIALQLERRVSFRRAMKKALADGEGFRRGRDQDSLRGPPGRRGTGARGDVSLGPRAVAHVAREH